MRVIFGAKEGRKASVNLKNHFQERRSFSRVGNSREEKKKRRPSHVVLYKWFL